jgi:hypothetical protein
MPSCRWPIISIAANAKLRRRSSRFSTRKVWFRTPLDIGSAGRSSMYGGSAARVLHMMMVKPTAAAMSPVPSDVVSPAPPSSPVSPACSRL